MSKKLIHYYFEQDSVDSPVRVQVWTNRSRMETHAYNRRNAGFRTAMERNKRIGENVELQHLIWSYSNLPLEEGNGGQNE